jgi:hypothetical protein
LKSLVSLLLIIKGALRESLQAGGDESVARVVRELVPMSHHEAVRAPTRSRGGEPEKRGAVRAGGSLQRREEKRSCLRERSHRKESERTERAEKRERGSAALLAGIHRSHSREEQSRDRGSTKEHERQSERQSLSCSRSRDRGSRIGARTYSRDESEREESERREGETHQRGERENGEKRERRTSLRCEVLANPIARDS